jgi:hypothetical protein
LESCLIFRIENETRVNFFIKKPNLDLNFEFIYGIGTKTFLIFFIKIKTNTMIEQRIRV